MKTNYFLITLSLIFALSSCNSKAPQNAVNATDSQKIEQSAEGQKLVVDTQNSKILWEGFSPGGSHHGTLGIKSGELFIDGRDLISGTFILDMNNITNEDLTVDQGRDKLIEHLKSPDFFDVQKYPEGKFTITKAEKLTAMDESRYMISGNLELKDIEKNISFNANIAKDGDVYKAQTDTFSINRTQWNINYASKNIFKDLKDKFINDDMEVSITIVAK